MSRWSDDYEESMVTPNYYPLVPCIPSGVARICPVGGHWGAFNFRRGALKFWTIPPPPKKKGPHFPAEQADKQQQQQKLSLLAGAGVGLGGTAIYKGIKQSK